MIPSGSDIQIDQGGFVRLHHAILEALSEARLSGAEFRHVMFLLRSTYGWNRKDAPLTLAQWAEGTKTAKSHVTTTLAALLRKRIIYRHEQPGQTPIYGFNKYIEQWQNVFDRDTARGARFSGATTKTPAKTADDNDTVTCLGNDTVTCLGNDTVTCLGNDTVTCLGNDTVTCLGNALTKTVKDMKDKESIGEIWEKAPPPNPTTGDDLPPVDLPAPPSATQGRATASRLAALNGQISPALRIPLVNVLLDVIGKRALAEIDNDDGSRVLNDAHEKAVTLYRLGYQSEADLLVLEGAWYTDDWRGKAGSRPTLKQFIEFASEHKSGKPKGANHATNRRNGNGSTGGHGLRRAADDESAREPTPDELAAWAEFQRQQAATGSR